MARHRLGCDLYTGQQVELLPALVEAGFRPHQRHHAAYAGRTLRAFHVQFAIAGALALLAMGADTVSAFQLHRPQGGEQALGALIVIPRLSAAGASGPWGGRSPGSASRGVNIAAPARCNPARVAISTASRSRPALFPRAASTPSRSASDFRATSCF